MPKFFVRVAALQFGLAAAAVQPVSTSTTIKSLSLAELNKIGEIMAINAANPPVPVGTSRAPAAILPPDVTLRGLPMNLVAGVYAESGIASRYSGGRTANGESVKDRDMTAAHRSLPFGTRVRVTHGINGNSVVVRINDRGPFIAGRIIDLTAAAAAALGLSGLAPVTLALAGNGL